MSEVVYKCKRCRKPFPDKWKYERHLARKTPCEAILDKDYAKMKANNKHVGVCVYCNRKMSNSYALTRHYATCKAYNDGDLIVAHVMKKQKDQTINHKKIVKELTKEIEELKNAISSPSLSISHTQTNYNSVTNNISINGPIIFGRDEMTEFLKNVLNSEEHALLVEMLKNRVGSLLRKNKPLEIVNDVLSFTHDNDQLPQGKNMFMATKGKYKNMIITLQEDGWAATTLSAILAIAKGEVVSVVRHVPFDPEHDKTMKCVDTFNDSEFIDQDIGTTIEAGVRKFELSKNNPTTKILPYDPKIAIKNAPPPSTKLAPIEFADYEVPPCMADIGDLEDSDESESVSENTKAKRKKKKEYVYVPPPTMIPNYEPPKRQEDVKLEDLTGFPMFD